MMRVLPETCVLSGHIPLAKPSLPRSTDYGRRRHAHDAETAHPNESGRTGLSDALKNAATVLE